ncbi:hypothetical protein NDU88_003436 [Pleurodeles waltl]|uniref:Uncharacterized protein n=1 Tax=Pleurodeles waltl TaxID=8319 RepID=A0AAV7KVK2_PLEWA|nr:hypothetical protein NDU88_003436 [Pleurodeles waltl]
MNAILNDHEYESLGSHKDAQSSQTNQNSSDDSNSFDSEDKSSPDKTQGKRKRKTRLVDDPLSSQASKNLLFDPEALIHPRSAEWTPCQEVATYVESRLRKSFEKDIRSTLHSECPRPALAGKVADTPELDPHMVTFKKKYTKNPKKGIDRAWRGCQDKLLDVSGPLKKIPVQAKEPQEAIDPDVLLKWAQRAICLLGNANCSISTERRKSLLLRIDPKLAELVPTGTGPAANGLLFGDRFVKDLAKYVVIFPRPNIHITEAEKNVDYLHIADNQEHLKQHRNTARNLLRTSVYQELHIKGSGRSSHNA